jgi:hypothetical protein
VPQNEINYFLHTSYFRPQVQLLNNSANAIVMRGLLHVRITCFLDSGQHLIYILKKRERGREMKRKKKRKEGKKKKKRRKKPKIFHKLLLTKPSGCCTHRSS